MSCLEESLAARNLKSELETARQQKERESDMVERREREDRDRLERKARDDREFNHKAEELQIRRDELLGNRKRMAQRNLTLDETYLRID